MLGANDLSQTLVAEYCFDSMFGVKLRLVSSKHCVYTYLTLLRRVSNMEKIEESKFEFLCRQLPPPLEDGRHKGQAGRIGIIGGSLEYTGAPYFAGISALKVGADLTHVFCTREAAPVIKSYSPELIVHPVLDNTTTAKEAVMWLDRLHVIVIGPGLGRHENTFNAVTELIEVCRTLKKPLVIDADGLFLLTQKPQLLNNYPAGVVLTPNAMEYQRLFGKKQFQSDLLKPFGPNCIVVRKGREDEIFDGSKLTVCTVKGSARRCGGQGDLLSGSVATFYGWAMAQQEADKRMHAMAACYAACKLTRLCNANAFAKHGRSMTCTDMIQEIGNVFKNNFEETK